MPSSNDRPQGEEKVNSASGKRKSSAAGKLLAFLAETVLLLALALFGAAYLICRGPSPRAAARFAAEAGQNRALAPLAALLLPEQPAKIEEYSPAAAPESAAAPDAAPAEDSPAPADGDEDGDGIIVTPIFGRGYSGYLMTVLDPSRVIVGCEPARFGGRGFTVADMAERFGAVAAINAGGFVDDGGAGNGATPDTLVVFEGEIYSAGRGTGKGFVGLDSAHRLHVGLNSVQEIRDADIQYGVCFGPVLVADGKLAVEDGLTGDLNPRTAIGQRADGAILLLVIDGRQACSMGASFWDAAQIMLEHGAVNACNLDGGSSSLLWYRGEYLNRMCLLNRPRPVPDTFLVLAEGG